MKISWPNPATDIFISFYFYRWSRNKWIAFETSPPDLILQSSSAWHAFGLTLCNVATVAIVVLDLRRLISISFLLNSGVVSSRKQATYPGMLSDSVVSNLDLVEDLYIWIWFTRLELKSLRLTKTMPSNWQHKAEMHMILI